MPRGTIRRPIVVLMLGFFLVTPRLGASDEDRKNLTPDMSAPKLLSRAEGVQTSPAAFKDLLPNNFALSFVVDEKGNVQQFQIEKPVGLGLDDAIAETILRWK